MQQLIFAFGTTVVLIGAVIWSALTIRDRSERKKAVSTHKGRLATLQRSAQKQAFRERVIAAIDEENGEDAFASILSLPSDVAKEILAPLDSPEKSPGKYTDEEIQTLAQYIWKRAGERTSKER